MVYSKYRIQDGYKVLDKWCVPNTEYRMDTKHLINGVFRIQGGYKSLDKWFILNTGRIQVT